MTEQEYFSAIEKIRGEIREGYAAEAMEKLDAMAEIRPVRLKWIVARAEAMLAGGCSYEEIGALLGDKSWYLYNYPDIIDYFKVYERLVKCYYDYEDAKRYRLIYSYLEAEAGNTESISYIREAKESISFIRKDFLEEPAAEKLLTLMPWYFIHDNQLMYFILYFYLKNVKEDLVYREWFLNFVNSGFLQETLREDNIPFVVINDTEVSEDIKVLLWILSDMGKNVIWIQSPLVIEVSEGIKLEDTVVISIENCEIEDNVYTYRPIELIVEGESAGDNRDLLLEELLSRKMKKKMAVVFTSGELLDGLCIQKVLKQKLVRMSAFQSVRREQELAFGRGGGYLPYMDIVHGMDTEKALEREEEYTFSIVVPARNSASSLRYTLMTCLQQRYQGNYEIVLSDNSSDGNEEIYELYQQLNDARIHYYRTPREYNLSKSFEYAFLQTRGEFILAIGSDDGLLPWTLEVLDEIIRKYPEENVFCWDRGFYAWPGFNGGQQNQFVIPSQYHKGDYRSGYMKTRDCMASILVYPELMYVLPMLYINSGFRRTYMKVLLEKTGCLWDGVGQDTYMGIINCAVNSRILRISYPLTIAGMSNASMGAKSGGVRKTVSEDMEFTSEINRTADVAGFTLGAFERLLPLTSKDSIHIYSSILRAIAKNVLPEEYIDKILDWKRLFSQSADSINILDIQFDKMLHYCRFTASLHGESFLAWFDEEIYRKKTVPVLIREKDIIEAKEKPSYQEMELENGGRILDASKYGVSNIYEASLLFESLTGL